MSVHTFRGYERCFRRYEPEMRISILLVVAMVKRTAAADPAPTNATRQLMTKLGDGTVPVTSLIDPTLGVWTFVDGKWTPNCSRNALLALMVGARVHARLYASSAQCANDKVDATCRLADTTDTFVPALELRFDRKPSGLVLRAPVWGEDQTPGKAPTIAMCPGAPPRQRRRGRSSRKLAATSPRTARLRPRPRVPC